MSAQQKNNSSHDIHRSFGLHQTSVEYNHHLILNNRDVKEKGTQPDPHQDHPHRLHNFPLKVSLTTDYHQPKPTRLLLIRLNDDEITLNCPRRNPSSSLASDD